MGDPPASIGSVQLNNTDEFPAIALKLVGVPGVVDGVALTEED